MVSIQRHLLNLRSLLAPGEAERAWVRAERVETSHLGALMVTDRRVLFSGLGFFAPSLDALPFAAVRRPVLDHGGKRDVLRFDVLGEARRYSAKPADAQRIHDALLAAMTAAGADPEAGADGGLTAELERLAALHAAGSLTDAEFAEAKRALLARPTGG